jgi:TRAP-type mannitol/chloroaromatic compound transport system permease large subunit
MASLSFHRKLMEVSGTAEKLFGALYLWLGGLRGGLAIATVLMGTTLAGCVGIIAASTNYDGSYRSSQHAPAGL